MNIGVRKWVAWSCLAAAFLCVPSLATAANVPAGVGGSPPPGPYVADPNGTILVDGGAGEPIPIFIDPNAPPWHKEFVIPSGTTLVPGQRFEIKERIHLIPPPPTDGSIPVLPITDWHEELHENNLGLPFAWGQGHLIIPSPITIVIQPPIDPPPPPTVIQPPPVAEVFGEVSEDGQDIWFGPFPGVNPSLYPGGIPSSQGYWIWIHKELVYTGSQTLSLLAPLTIPVWEYPTVPEPSSALLALVAAVGLAGFRGRRWWC